MQLGWFRWRRFFLILIFILIPLFSFFFLLSCQTESEGKVYRIGYFQLIDSITANEAKRGFFQALQDSGLWPSDFVEIEVRNALGEIQKVQEIAEEYSREKKDLIVAHSTPCLQAAIMATRRIPIIFMAVANPFLVNAGRTTNDHLPNVTGVTSTGPIAQVLAFIKEVLPTARRVGTLWTPSELNSEYYFQLAREAAIELGLEIVAVPVSSSQDVLISAQILAAKKIDCFFPISDNTINAAFDSVARVAEETMIPLFGSFLLAARAGACAALGLDFFAMGYEAGKLVERIKKGENPAQIPFIYPQEIKLHLNLLAAKKQGISFSPEILKRADEIITEVNKEGKF
ncbi:MAG: ABC transporter substrate-binding protein [Candidatus Aminicenantes bacterium]|nr:ABC transporter substrate-binding protein [Candidatus Aminicenantes bacterium]